MVDIIDTIFSIFFAIPIEYLIIALIFIVALLYMRFSQYRVAQFFAFPVAIIIWLSIEFFQFLKCLQLSFLKQQVQQGNRYKVLIIFLLVITTGISLYLISYVFLALMTISPWYYLPSFILSTISKYINLVLVPSVIRHGSDKLNTFGTFRWAYHEVSAFWARFKQYRLYQTLAKTMEMLRTECIRIVNSIKSRRQNVSSKSSKPSVIKKGVIQVTAIIDNLNQRK